MDQKELYEKMIGMATDGLTKVHEKFMAEMEKNDDISVVRDYALSMHGLSTLISAIVLLKPAVPNWVNYCSNTK